MDGERCQIVKSHVKHVKSEVILGETCTASCLQVFGKALCRMGMTQVKLDSQRDGNTRTFCGMPKQVEGRRQDAWKHLHIGPFSFVNISFRIFPAERACFCLHGSDL